MLEKLQLSLDVLNTQRAQVARAGWVLQHCWLVQVKPGGTARTNVKYWQVRSRQPIFEGKKLKHLKPNEVEAYRAAIDRGRQIRQIDRQIEKLQRRIAELSSRSAALSRSSENLSASQEPFLEPAEQFSRKPLQRVEFANLAEQERLVKAVLADTQVLRASLQQSLSQVRQLGERNIALQRGHSHHPGDDQEI